MSILDIKIGGAVLASSESEALSRAVAKATSFITSELDEVVVHITPSARRANTGFLEWGLDVHKGGKRLIYLGMIQRHATAPFEFHS